MTFRTLFALVPVLLATACAGTATHTQMLQREGALRVDPVDGADHQFRVTLQNVLDFGFDPDVPADRHRAALDALRQECAKAEVVGEQMIDGGRNWIGRSLRTYVMRVRCERRPA